MDGEDLASIAIDIKNWKIPYSKLLSLNSGDEFENVDERAKRVPAKIPKKIHQVWLGTKELPLAKKYFLAKTKKVYPSYEIKLWREENITREAFPNTYEVIQTLLDFNKRSPYNKAAAITDIIRHEILYQEGGFWKDSGVNLLRPIFDKFLTYRAVVGNDMTFRHRWLQGMCFFANVPKAVNIARINNFRNLNRMRIYSWYAIGVAGPIDFRQFVLPHEENDPDVLTLPYEKFYPGQINEHPLKDQCTIREE